MTQGSKKIFAILLSLALALLPMQSAFAGVFSLDQDDGHASHTMTDMQQTMSIPDCDNHTDCSAGNACGTSDNCPSGHCVSSLVGILDDATVSQYTSNQIEQVSLNYSVLPQYANSLYRPPSV